MNRRMRLILGLVGVAAFGALVTAVSLGFGSRTITANPAPAIEAPPELAVDAGDPTDH